MDSRWLGVIVLIIILGAGGWYIFSHPVTPTPVTDETPSVTDTTDQQASTTTTNVPPTPVTITYTDSGFSPKTVTVQPGQTVMWVNRSSHGMWVAAAAHPSHTVYDGTSKDMHCASNYTGAVPFDECGANPNYSFTFGKVGTWKYHNHTSAGMTGTVVVAAVPAVTASTSVNVQVQ